MWTWKEVTSCSLGVKNKAKTFMSFILSQDMAGQDNSQANGERVRNHSQEVAGVSHSIFIRALLITGIFLSTGFLKLLLILPIFFPNILHACSHWRGSSWRKLSVNDAGFIVSPGPFCKIPAIAILQQLTAFASLSMLNIAQEGITDNTMTFGTRNTSNISALTLPASFAETVTVERMLKGMGGETRQTHLEWFCTTVVFTGRWYQNNRATSSCLRQVHKALWPDRETCAPSQSGALAHWGRKRRHWNWFHT